MVKSHLARLFGHRVEKKILKPWKRYTTIARETPFHSLLGEEAEASPSVGNTLWRVSTMFTRSAITTPEVNGFG